MNKFEIGTQWKTRGGWRAVVVAEINDGQLLVWHRVCVEQVHDTHGHNLRNNGEKYNSPAEDFDLIEPWKDPIEHEVWINMYPHQSSTKQGADEVAKEERLACVKVRYTEGDGL